MITLGMIGYIIAGVIATVTLTICIVLLFNKFNNFLEDHE